jgi:hypothetical protein
MICSNRLPTMTTHPDRSNAQSHLLQLPYELLYDILCYVLPLETRQHPLFLSTENVYVQTPLYRDVLAIRSTCQIFRRISNELPFWLDDNFEFLDFWSSRTWRRLHELAEVLLADGELASHLGRKKAWCIGDVETFQSLTRHVSSFPHHIEQLQLYCGPTQLQGSIIPDVLSEFSNLRYLRLTFDPVVPEEVVAPISCGPLPTSLRSLCIDTRATQMDGIDSIKTLSEFSFRIRLDLSSPFTRILPTQSSSTLSHLSLNLGRHTLEQFDYSALDTFVNLKGLSVQPSAYAHEFYWYLSRSCLRLVSFALIHPHNPAAFLIPDILTATPALRQLKNLCIAMPSRQIQTMHRLERIVDAISTLTSLENLHLHLHAHLPWCRRFKTLTRLQKLEWVLIPDSQSVLTGVPPALLLKQELSLSLQHLVPTPLILTSTSPRTGGPQNFGPPEFSNITYFKSSYDGWEMWKSWDS